MKNKNISSILSSLLNRDKKKVSKDSLKNLPAYLNPDEKERDRLIRRVQIPMDGEVLSKRDLPYFIVIVLFSLLAHLYIIKSGKLYGVEGTDSTVQMMYFLPFLINELFMKGHFWSWHYGMGGDIFSEFSYYYTTSPIIWLMVPVMGIAYLIMGDGAFSLENSLRLKLFISIFKQILFMSFMYGLLKYEKRTETASVVGALIYGGGLFYIWNANYFDTFTDAYLWVPLMVLGYRIYERKKNFWPLLISAALAAVNNFYFAFHTFIFFIVFVMIMTVSEGCDNKSRIKDYFKKFFTYGAIGIGSLLLSSFAFIPQVLAFLKIDRFAVNYPVSLFFDSSFYKNLPVNLFFNSSTIGIPMIIIFAIFINYKKTTTLTNRKVILLLVFIVLYMLPFTGYFLNGMNYHSERWFYLLIFVFAYASADITDEARRKNNFNMIFVFIAFLSFILMLFFRRKELANYSKYMYLNIATIVFNLLAFFSLSSRKLIDTSKTRRLLDHLLVLSVAGALIFNNFAYAMDQGLNMDTEKMKEKNIVTKELKDIFSKVQTGDREFARTVFRGNNYENAPTYFKYNGISTFSSMTDGNLHNYLKKVLDIRHDIVYLSSFNNLDDRNYLEALLGVKYIVVEKGSYTPPSTYKKEYENEKYELYTAKNSVGMDLWYKGNISLSSFQSLDIADKDLNLMNYAVTEENYPSELLHMPLSSESIELNDKTMKLNNVTYGKDRIIFNKDSNVIIKPEKDMLNSQLYLHSKLRPVDKKEFTQRVSGKKSFKADESNPYVYHTNEWTFVINGSERELRWETDAKEYELHDLYVKRINLDDLSKSINERNAYNLENLRVSGNNVSGIIDNRENGFLVLNIPYNKGWRLTVDGKETDLKRMNGFMSGMYLEKGKHDIKLTFIPRGLIPGTIISIATLTFLLIYYKLTKRRRLRYAIETQEREWFDIKKQIFEAELKRQRFIYKKNLKLGNNKNSSPAKNYCPISIDDNTSVEEENS